MDIDFKELFDCGGYYEKTREKVLEGDGALSAEEESEISLKLSRLDDVIRRSERLKLQLGQLADYNRLKKQGVSAAKLKEYEREDAEFLQKADGLCRKNLYMRDYMFGYPANLESFSYFSDYLRFLEGKMYLMNNCGDPYQKGNYGMDSKELEQQIIAMFAENIGLKGKRYWGYITSGGTESNFWAIREGFEKVPRGKLYFSAEAHYSINKFAAEGGEGQMHPYRRIPANPDGSINVEELLYVIESDVKYGGVRGAVLMLTWGTTEKGAVDSVREITEGLNRRGIPYYCHVDAAHYGGISSSQKHAPVLGDITSLGIDSVSISLHKFIGLPRVNGVLIALDRGRREVINYIGQEDSTLLGSRDILPFSTYQRVKEMLFRTPENYYCENILFFENLLKQNGIAYERHNGTGNVFVVAKPSLEICKKYQLADITGEDGVKKAHIIVFPFHKKEIIRELVEDLKNDN